MNTKNLICKEIRIDSNALEIPPRHLPAGVEHGPCPQDRRRVDERIANEPKVSYRGGRYYVFDGQHTIAARKLLNGGKDLPIAARFSTG